MNGELGFEPIGWVLYGDNDEIIEGAPFIGTFDGRGHVIRNLYINRPDEDHIGLFGAVEWGGEINRLGLVEADITGGGLVGTLAGANYSGTITNCGATGAVSGKIFTGGLVGFNAAVIINCYSTSYSTGVASFIIVGGLVGGNEGTITNSYATGAVSGMGEGGTIGGLVGSNGDRANGITNCYATGAVSVSGGDLMIGGLIGLTLLQLDIMAYNYWDIQTTSQSVGASTGFGPGENGIFGRTTAEMMLQETYINWDFEVVWAIDPNINDGYPYLRDNPPPFNPDPAPTPAPPLAKSRAANFTVGPNPVGSGDVINFFWDGDEIISGTFSIYSASGELVNTVNIGDVDNLNKSHSSSSGDVKRQIGSWNIVDRRSRKLPAGSYLVRGVITTVDGRRERVSVVVGVR
jgi:hypothetical protein